MIDDYEIDLNRILLAWYPSFADNDMSVPPRVKKIDVYIGIIGINNAIGKNETYVINKF